MKTLLSPPWPYLLLLPLLEAISSPCPSPCQCKWLEGKYTLDCVERNITRFPLSGDNIEAVILDKNDFSKLEAFEFVNSGLGHVRKVSMKFCKLDKFEDDLLSGLTNLHDLDLSHNMLTQLSRNQFPSLPELRSLDLSKNYLRSIHKDSFSNLGSMLVRIDLSGNSLISIPWTIFIPLPNLKQLSLGDNPWHCDCQLGDLHSELTRKAIIPTQATCSTPRALSTKHWATFHSTQFTCSPSVSLPHPHQHAVLPGQLVPLHCQVAGNPTPSVTWRQNGNTMPKGIQDTYSIRQTKSGEGHSTAIFSVLAIRNMSSSALGTYSCLAKNTVGIDEKEIRISFYDSAEVFEELENSPVILIVGISAATVIIVIITLMLIVCCIREFKDDKSRSSSHSTSFTILDYKDKKPSKDLDLFRPSWTNPMPKPPRTGAYDKMSCEDIPGTLSRSSTRQSYLLADPCDGDTSHLSVDGYDCATLPRSDTDWTRYENTATTTYSTNTLHLLPPFSNLAGSRASIGTISTIDPIYGTVRRTLPPQYAYAPHYQAMPTVCHARPGYVTLPRRPKINRRPALPLGDCLGPRSSADGCSHSNISTLPLNMYSDHHQCKSTMLPPYSPPPPASITAINTVGLPAVEIPSPEEDAPMRTSTPKSAQDLSPPASRGLLDTILEQD